MYQNLKALHEQFIMETTAEKVRLIDEANALADEARSIISRIQENIAKHEALSAIMGEAADDAISNYSGVEEMLGNIKEALKDFNDSELPEGRVELFEGYCEYCGEELTTDNVHLNDGGYLICTDCAVAEDEAEEQ